MPDSKAVTVDPAARNVPAARRARRGSRPGPDQPASRPRGTHRPGAADAGSRDQRAGPCHHRPAPQGYRGLAAGLAAITAAAVSGAALVSNERADASMAMAVLTGVALLSYLANLLLASPAAAITPWSPDE